MGVLGVFSGVLMFSRCFRVLMGVSGVFFRCFGMFSGCFWVSPSVCGVFSGVL